MFIADNDFQRCVTNWNIGWL